MLTWVNFYRTNLCWKFLSVACRPFREANGQN